MVTGATGKLSEPAAEVIIMVTVSDAVELADPVAAKALNHAGHVPLLVIV